MDATWPDEERQLDFAVPQQFFVRRMAFKIQ